MMFTKLKQIINAQLGIQPVDCVIGVRFSLDSKLVSNMNFFQVPCYMTDAERRAMFDAAQIGGWNCLRLLNETTAGK